MPATSDRTTREALMDAALDQIEERGVLAGLNLREVAAAAGVTTANIYHLFGSRQGLLRAALGREAAALATPLEEASRLGFVDRRLRMFDAIVGAPTLRLTALLALDGDPDYSPLPFVEASQAWHAELAATGGLDPDVDAEALHLLGVATSIGVAIYAEAAARQLDTDPDELTARVRAVLARLLGSVVPAG
ncbi:MAG TPA: TetR family transcriptional regulator [Iamia sp.]